MPADVHKSCEQTPSLYTWPLTHAALKEMLSRSDPASPCSRRSATTRRASACALARASSAVLPYASTPGSSFISAIHLPSSSCSSSTLRVIMVLILADPRWTHHIHFCGPEVSVRCGGRNHLPAGLAQGRASVWQLAGLEMPAADSLMRRFLNYRPVQVTTMAESCHGRRYESLRSGTRDSAPCYCRDQTFSTTR